ncbi:MAG: tRNA pseudouridine(38-40) synthase TruA [Erysipelotrichaceae bacterium]|nr:tRNA pseudouridine(38-40) synthase TruA [Erysipelotrichaceae bacterium]
MKRYKCTVAYCGAHYSGWQIQPDGNSIQDYIERAIREIAHEPVHITASGRTDAGVNAWGQVFHFDTETVMKPRKWTGAINSRLPDDIHIRLTEEAPKFFHARFCVRSKCYEYRINLGEYDVFSKDYAYQCPYELDVDLMKQASLYLVGTHDFTSLNSTPLKEIKDQVRTVDSIDFRHEGNQLVLSFTGKGFLRYMVRMMTAQLMEVGRHRMTPEELNEMLEARSKRVDRRNAKPEGLSLMEVGYFDILGMTDEMMIREYLRSDVVPDWYRLEERYAGKPELFYVMTERHGQRVTGILECSENNSPARLLIDDENDLEQAEEMLKDASAYLKEHDLSEGCEIVVR